jgi:hypothetical protein
VTTGYYATPDIGYDHDKNEGNPFNYFTFGVATRLNCCFNNKYLCDKSHETNLKINLFLDPSKNKRNICLILEDLKTS